MAENTARSRQYARNVEEQDENYYDDDSNEPSAAFQTPDFDTALRMAHHAQRLKALELGLEHFSQNVSAFKADQRRMFRRQTVISLGIGGICIMATLFGMVAVSTSHRQPAPAAAIASATPQPVPNPTPVPSYIPPQTAPVTPQPTINSYPAAQAPAAPLQPMPQIQAQAQEEPTLEMPVPVSKPVEVTPPAKPIRKLSAFETAVTERLSTTSQSVPDSWMPLFTHEAGGDVRAKLQIAAKFLKGEDVKADPTFALTLIRQAATAGNKEAMMWLAYSYQSGNLGKPDPVNAARWFSEAAKSGVTGAYAELGKLYEKGVDGAPDPETALSWYQRAAAAGDANAAQSVQRLNRAIMNQNTLVPAEPTKPAAAAIAPAIPQQQPAPVAARTENTNARAAASAASDDLNAAPDGERSADIRAAQRMLKVLGYKIDKADGTLGPQTQNAIRGYQRDHAAYPDGQFTPQLLENLTRDIRFGQ